MRNPLRSEAEAFRFLIVVIAGAIVVVAAAYLNTWVGVAAAVLVAGGIVAWLLRAPAGPPRMLVSSTPGSTHRVLVVAAPGTSSAAGRIGDGATEILVLVPALASTVEALTGAVDDRRAEAQQTADTLADALSRADLEARGVVGADDPVLAVEDALAEFGAAEIVLGSGFADEALLAKLRERFAIPVSRL